MVFGPGDRRLAHDARGLAAKAFAGRMQRELGDGRADGEQAHRRAVPSKIGIARKRARDDLERQRRSHAVPDNDDLVERRVPRARSENFGKAIDPRLDIGRRPYT